MECGDGVAQCGCLRRCAELQEARGKRGCLAQRLCAVAVGGEELGLHCFLDVGGGEFVDSPEECEERRDRGVELRGGVGLDGGVEDTD